MVYIDCRLWSQSGY